MTAGLPDALSLPGRLLPLQVSSNRQARRMSLRICMATRSLRLTLPPRTSRARALRFLEDQRGWIIAQAEKRLLPPIPFAPGVVLPVAGNDLLLQSCSGRLVRVAGDRLLVPGEGEVYAGRVRRWLQRRARDILDSETRALARRVDRPVQAVRVGEYRSRWGSCAADGRIAYSWRLIFAPDAVRRSVVAHEVAHLVEMNHGARFWALATELLGTPHDAARQWLRAHAPLLMRYGAREFPLGDQDAARALAMASFNAS